MKPILPLAAIALAAATFAVRAPAAPTSADALGTCLVEHTSQQDRTTFVKWLFAQMALAPAVAPMVSVSAKQREALNVEIGKLFMRLVTQDCANEARTAYLVQGSTAIEGGFRILGAAAGRSLMLDPHVSAGMSGFTKYLDKAKIDAVLAGSSAGSAPAAASTTH